MGDILTYAHYVIFSFFETTCRRSPICAKMRLSRKWRRRGPCATSRSSFGCKYKFFVFFLSLYKIVLKIICKKFFCSLRAQNFILRNRSIFAGFLPISIVTWLELVPFKKYETDLTEFACKWLHMFKNSCLFCKIAPAGENSLRAMLTFCTH